MFPPIYILNCWIIRRKCILNFDFFSLSHSRSFSFQAMLMYKSVYLLITILVFETSFVNGSNQLHIGGIFPIMGKGGWQGGQGEFDWTWCEKIYDIKYHRKHLKIFRTSFTKSLIYLSLFITHIHLLSLSLTRIQRCDVWESRDVKFIHLQHSRS